MGFLVMFFSLIGAGLFGFLAFTDKKRVLLLLPPAMLLALLGGYEIYLDFWWQKTVVAPIRVDLLITPFIVMALWAWSIFVLCMVKPKF